MIKKYSEFKLNEKKISVYDIYKKELLELGFTVESYEDEGYGEFLNKTVFIPFIGDIEITISSYDKNLVVTHGIDGDVLLTVPFNKEKFEWLKNELTKCK